MLEQTMRPALTMKQAAQVLGVSLITVRRRVDRGDIGVFRLGRSVRIPAAEIDRLTSTNTRPVAA